jgi:xylose isomerase
MATTNLFSHPAFKDGAFTANDPKVRALALRKTMDAIDLGVELGARIYVFWGGREGSEADACRDPRAAIARMRDALDFLCEYVRDRRYELVFALEAKPNEPRGDIYFPTTGHMLHFITTLAHPDMVGVNPEVAHETMSGLSFVHAVAQAMEASKLFHIDLNAQKIGSARGGAAGAVGRAPRGGGRPQRGHARSSVRALRGERDRAGRARARRVPRCVGTFSGVGRARFRLSGAPGLSRLR